MLRFFSLSNLPMYTIMDERSVNKHRVSHGEMIYVNYINERLEPNLVTAFNSSTPLKRFGSLLPDAYVLTPNGYKLFFFHGKFMTAKLFMTAVHDHESVHDCESRL